MLKRSLFAAAIALCLPAAADPADAVDLTILPGWDTENGTRMIGLKFRLDEGWKTYWRAPGDAGIPPAVSWRGSKNITGATFHWPTPDIQNQSGMRTLGYQDTFTIPVELARKSSGALRAKGKLEIGVCNEICVPITLRFDAALPDAGARDSAIISALIDQPMTAKEGRVTQSVCNFSPTSDGAKIEVRLKMPSLGPNEVAVIEAGDPRVWVAEPTLARQGGWLIAKTRMYHDYDGPMGINRSQMRFTILGGGQAVDVKGCTAG
jgi:DsbC/DsbD-like thiol-disulfide interchange protein